MREGKIVRGAKLIVVDAQGHASRLQNQYNHVIIPPPSILFHTSVRITKEPPYPQATTMLSVKKPSRRVADVLNRGSHGAVVTYSHVSEWMC